MNVYEKLNKARLLLQMKDLKKSGHNKFAGYQYFELSDFMPEVISIFNEVGLCGYISFKEDLATLLIVDVAQDGKSIEITSPMRDANLKGTHPIQNLGAVETYTRRYLWVTAMEIVEHDALDSSEPLRHPLAPKESAKTIAMSEWDKLPKEEQEFLQGIADKVIEANLAFGIETAVKALEDAKLDQDEKVAIWSRFDSKLRSAIKQYQSEQRKAA